MEVEPTIDALVSTFLLLCAACTHQAERPPLELEGVFLGEFPGVRKGGRFADDLVRFGHLVAERVAEPAFDEAYGEVCDVDADPVSLEALRDGDSRAAAAKGVEDGVALVGTGASDALKKGFRFLGGIAETFCRLCGNRVDIRDYVTIRTPASSFRYRLNPGTLPFVGQ